MSTVDLIKSRIEMYQKAETVATSSGDSSKARRYNRALKTLKDLLKKAEKGTPINPSEVPPEVSIPKTEDPPETDLNESASAPPPVPARKAPGPPKTAPPELPVESTVDPRIEMLNARKGEFKKAALEAKQNGNTAMAIKYIKTVKQFDMVIEALKNGQEVDLSNMPSLTQMKTTEPTANEEPAKEESETQQDAPVEAPELITANSIEEALQQHMEKFKTVEQAAKDEGNASKARRIGRVVKQFEQTIKLHRAGKPFSVEDLPVPQGYAPIPVPKPATAQPAVPPEPVPTTPQPNISSASTSQNKITPEKEHTRISGNAKNTTLMDKQVAFLLGRQKEFRLAAVEAKKAGEMEQAKEYLRISKGLENMLEAARCGFPVEMATVPIPPSKREQLEDGFTVISQEDVIEGDIGFVWLLK